LVMLKCEVLNPPHLLEIFKVAFNCCFGERNCLNT
jgi:hypothetical protein